MKHLYVPGEGGRASLDLPMSAALFDDVCVLPSRAMREGDMRGGERSEPASDHLIILDLPAGFLRR